MVNLTSTVVPQYVTLGSFGKTGIKVNLKSVGLIRKLVGRQNER